MLHFWLSNFHVFKHGTNTVNKSNRASHNKIPGWLLVFPKQLTVSALGFIASTGHTIEFFNFYSSTMTSILIKAVSL